MKKYVYIKKVIIGATLGAVALFGVALTASARTTDPNKAMVKWQSAKERADARYNAYLSSGRSSDFRKWQTDESRLRRRADKLEKAGVDTTDLFAKDETNVSSTTVEYAKNENPEDVDIDSSDKTVVANTDMKDTSLEKPENETSEEVDVNRPDTVDVDKTDVTVVKTIPMDPEHVDKAKDSVRMGYIHGYRKGHRDMSRGHHYSDTAVLPYRDPYEPPIIPSHKYKPFYAEGFKRGYEDGYNNTMKYGEHIGKGKGYTVYSSVEDAVVTGVA